MAFMAYKQQSGRYRSVLRRMFPAGCLYVAGLFCVTGCAEVSRQTGDAVSPHAGMPGNAVGNKEIDDNLKVLLLLARGSEVPGKTLAQTRANYESALDIYRKIIDSGARGRALHQSYFGLGRCYVALGRPWAAFVAIEKSFPLQLEPTGVQQRVSLEYKIARQLMARGEAGIEQGLEQDKAMQKKINGYQAASRVFNRIVYNDPRSAEAPKALLALGDCQVRLGDLDAAENAYRRLLRNGYEKTVESYEARAALAGVLIGKDYGASIPQAVVQEAKALLRECSLVPEKSSALCARIEKARTQRVAAGARDLLRQARFHMKQGNRKTAVFLLKDILKLYPETSSAVKAAKYLQRLEPQENGDGRDDKHESP